MCVDYGTPHTSKVFSQGKQLAWAHRPGKYKTATARDSRAYIHTHARLQAWMGWGDGKGKTRKARVLFWILDLDLDTSVLDRAGMQAGRDGIGCGIDWTQGRACCLRGVRDMVHVDGIERLCTLYIHTRASGWVMRCDTVGFVYSASFR